MALAPKTYTDIKYGFERNSGGDISPVYDENSINQSLMTLFLTLRGERFFNPNYGTNIKRLLFEPLDTTTANSIISEIQTSITDFEGIRITIKTLNINVDYDSGVYRVFLEYYINSTIETGTLNFTLAKG